MEQRISWFAWQVSNLQSDPRTRIDDVFGLIEWLMDGQENQVDSAT